MRFFNLIGLISLRSTLPEIGARLTGGAAVGDTSTAFGIFSRFQVTDFDLLGLFLLRHLFSFSVGLCCASDAEEQLMAARNVLFWNQVIEANQFLFSALAPFIS